MLIASPFGKRQRGGGPVAARTPATSPIRSPAKTALPPLTVSATSPRARGARVTRSSSAAVSQARTSLDIVRAPSSRTRATVGSAPSPSSSGKRGGWGGAVVSQSVDGGLSRLRAESGGAAVLSASLPHAGGGAASSSLSSSAGAAKAALRIINRKRQSMQRQADKEKSETERREKWRSVDLEANRAKAEERAAQAQTAARTKAANQVKHAEDKRREVVDARNAAASAKAQRRAEIYALNRIMRAHNERMFQEFKKARKADGAAPAPEEGAGAAGDAG